MAKSPTKTGQKRKHCMDKMTYEGFHFTATRCDVDLTAEESKFSELSNDQQMEMLFNGIKKAQAQVAPPAPTMSLTSDSSSVNGSITSIENPSSISRQTSESDRSGDKRIHDDISIDEEMQSFLVNTGLNPRFIGVALEVFNEECIDLNVLLTYTEEQIKAIPGMKTGIASVIASVIAAYMNKKQQSNQAS